MKGCLSNVDYSARDLYVRLLDNLARFADRGGDAVPVHVGPQVRTDTREDRAQAGDER